MKIFNHTIYASTKIDRHDKTSALSVPSVVDTYQYGYVDNEIIINKVVATELGISKSQITGLGTDGLIARSLSTDINGNTAKSETFVDASTKTVTQKSDSPDSTVDSESVTVNGLLQTSKTKTGTIYTYSYDDLGRRIGTTDPRTGKSVVKYNTKGQVESVTDADNKQTKFTYDANTGRRTSVENALTKKSYTAYNAKGQVYRVWGDTTYPMEYTYDDFGRMVSLKTFRGGQNWTAPTFPSEADRGESDETKWTYNQATGLLTAKKYADGHGPSYTYNAAGQLKTRTWARGTTTTYNYNQTTRALTNITYSDNTPTVGFTYDRLGRQTNVTDVQGNRTFAYNDKLQLATETVNIGDTGVSKTITRKYDNLGRSAGFEFGKRKVAYGYDNYGRFNAVKTSALSAPSVVDTYQYSYVANTPSLVESVTGPAHTVTNTYEPHRNVLTNKNNSDNSVNPVQISNFAYTINKLGQRTALTTSGTAYTTAPAWAWSYNGLGELVQAVNTNAAAQNRAYQYDGIGNRQKTTNGLQVDLPQDPNYTTNALNQYTKIGTATPAYDADGNATSYPVPAQATSNSTLIWDAENRLIEVKTSAGTSIATYAYDYQGRRISKTANGTTTYSIYDGWNKLADYTTANSTPTIQKTYLWGMDLSGSMQGAGGVGGLLAVNELSIINSQLSIISYYATYDGNGNVSEYLDKDGAVVAHYEYDGFGNTLLSNGAKANDFAYRFSTKPLDAETGLYYYGYRYYDATTGRWPSRDPIQEKGGLNLYGFVGNNGVSRIDVLGLNTPREWLIQSLQGSINKEIFRIPLGPGAVVLNIAFEGKLFKCCNKKTGEYEKWGSAKGTVELFYQIGYSRKPKPDPVKGRDRNVRVPHPCKKGETVKKKHYHAALLVCLKSKPRGGGSGTAGLFIPLTCPEEEGIQFSGQLFIRGAAGIGVGVTANVTYNINPDSPVSWSNLGGGFEAGWVGWGASIDAGGSGSGEYLKSFGKWKN